MTTPPSLLASLVERLRKNAPAATRPAIAAIMDEAATALEALAAERDALRKTLTSIADAPAAACAREEAAWDFREQARATLERTPQP